MNGNIMAESIRMVNSLIECNIPFVPIPYVSWRDEAELNQLLIERLQNFSKRVEESRNNNEKDSTKN